MTDSENTPRVALLGTGTMGAGMARNIAAAGLPLTVWNRSREKAEPLADVATVADTAAEAVAGADLVVTMVFDADSVLSCLEDVTFAEGAVLVQCTTVGADGADRLAAFAAERGVAYVDSPVLGTKKPAEEGTLTILASGDDDLLERARPVHEAMGGRTVRVGAAGTGSRLKLACNAWLATAVEGIAESMAFTRAFGLDPQLFLDAMEGSALDAPYVQVKGKAILADDFTPSFEISGGLKDVRLMLAAAEDLEFSPRLLPALAEQWQRAVDGGDGDQDLAVTYRHL